MSAEDLQRLIESGQLGETGPELKRVLMERLDAFDDFLSFKVLICFLKILCVLDDDAQSEP